jgi:hypothetical protein
MEVEYPPAISVTTLASKWDGAMSKGKQLVKPGDGSVRPNVMGRPTKATAVSQHTISYAWGEDEAITKRGFRYL